MTDYRLGRIFRPDGDPLTPNWKHLPIGYHGRAGTVVRISPDLVMTPEFVRRAQDLVRTEGATGITVSAFRERLGTSRKYALPLLEWFDQRGVTRREGDLRFPRAPANTG